MQEPRIASQLQLANFSSIEAYMFQSSGPPPLLHGCRLATTDCSLAGPSSQLNSFPLHCKPVFSFFSSAVAEIVTFVHFSKSGPESSINFWVSLASKACVENSESSKILWWTSSCVFKSVRRSFQLANHGFSPLRNVVVFINVIETCVCASSSVTITPFLAAAFAYYK